MMMESLNWKVEYREHLFHKKFEYRLTVKEPSRLSTSNIDDYISSKENFYRPQINYNLLSRIFAIKARENYTDLCRFNYYENNLHIYSNDSDLLEDLAVVSEVVSTARAVCEQGIKYFARKPEYKYRQYFRNTRVSREFLCDIAHFVNTQDNIRVSKSLDAFLRRMGHGSISGRYQWPRCYVYSEYFIDYNDESLATYMTLMMSDVLGRRFKLEQRPQ